MNKIETNPFIYGPCQIIKHFRGNYQVLDGKGREMFNHYVSLHEATRMVIAIKLQDKALVHPGVLQKAEAFTTLKGDELNNWLYTTLIRFEIQELRLVINKPTKLKELYKGHIERLNAILKKQEFR